MCVHFSYIFSRILLDVIIITINLIQLLAAILIRINYLSILYFFTMMDSIIRQAVREELRRSSSSRPETASSTNQDDEGRSENESDAAGSSRSSFSSRTVGRSGCF